MTDRAMTPRTPQCRDGNHELCAGCSCSCHGCAGDGAPMGTDDTAFVILLRYRYGDFDSVAPGSVVIPANCGHRAFISPQGVAFLDGDGAGSYTVCSDCAETEEIIRDQQREKYVLPGVMDSIVRWKGVAEADQIAAWARDYGFKPLRGGGSAPKGE